MFFSKDKYYKNRIILTFTGVSAGIILFLIFVINIFVKDIFTEQIKDQAVEIANLISGKFEPRYLTQLNLGPPSRSFNNHFSNLATFNFEKAKSDYFIFNSDLEVLIHSEKNIEFKSVDPLLTIFEESIKKINEDEIISTIPFQTKSGNWYLFAFRKLNSDFYFGYKVETVKFKQLNKFSQYINYFAVISIILIIIIAFFLARSITKPINKLVQFSLHTGMGETSFPIPKNLKGELKILSDALDKMHNGLLNNQKEKENMLAQIAHEIRNPLGGIELLTSLIKEETTPDSQNFDYLKTILSEISRLKTLITSFLEYSKPVPANPEWIAISELINEINSVIKNKIDNREIKFSFNTELEKIYFDPVHMKQVLINLISNSIEAIEKEGKIEADLIDKDSEWILKVSNSGEKINSQITKELFKPFFTTKKDGTGLGLAISKKLCNENNANIYFDESSDLTSIIIKKKK